ncbi:non-ribosomal peptide synthetase [Nocardia asteroides NBRC 15531]|uniref:Non-ribosomal peptide synthetase n=2 Tax=Nocardia asteroides TaxID=1824 RepID=U5E805_NOCAS|nr:non-ribosomal peptide synthetase [Nocardia asteroides]TLF65443.1 non-ribosomal peptide synthetase [Nocardia asteroides NBRC 15531]UGT47801.1 non-ribosomal peptide synthetase [Nocardia asteroides]SFM56042.1 mycobactin peptide synthetase MbtE [Nocardia asteroides]VEG33274.1 Dimodular nonribosomal peptide synthase [Nocardia asteroides]BAO99084.1 non-ribosomal peptide synthetase [Nocardia asteroides]
MSDTEATLSVAERRKLLLQQKLRDSGMAAATPEPVAVPRIAAGERRPLTPGQRRMWFLQTRDADDTALTICVAYRLTGPLDGERLRAAFDTVVARHDILRTTYGADAEGEPFQVFTDDARAPWQTHDLTDLAESGRDLRVEVLARREFGRPFDLATELPVRVTLIRTGADEHVILFAVHHICWDDDSWAVFFAELNAAYRAGSGAAGTVQFAALAPTAEPAEADVAYWRDTLRPLPEPLELPGSAAAAPGRQAQRRTHRLPAELVTRTEQFAREQAATPFMVLLAGFDALMHRYTAADDFLVSIPVTDRPAGTEELIGYFGNTLLLRATFGTGDDFAGLVAAVCDTCANGFARRGVGIDRVVREANPDRVAGRDGMDQLVRLGFSVRKSADGFAIDGVTSRQLELGAVSAQVPLALAIVLEDDGTAVVEAEYQTDVLTEALVDQLLAHYGRLLDAALADPRRRLADLDMLGADDRAALLERSHGVLADQPATTLTALFEAAAGASPDAPALASDDIELSYAALHARANRLAHWLIAQGIGTEDIVGLRLGTSVEFIVAVLAVLKAGGAYLPIDPAYPDDRIDYLVADARPRLLLGAVEFAAAESAAAELPEVAPTDADRLRPLLPANLAYVIYTSGSTGKPKGVPVPHAAIAEHIVCFTADWSMTARDRLMQSSSVSFDASLVDIAITLTVGAQLIVPKPNAFRDIRYVADLITRRQVTVLHMVPSMLSTFLLLPEVSEWRSLRQVPVGGEALPGEVADRFANTLDAELRNHYGPTEAVVCSTHMPVAGPQGTGVVPIGIPNRNVYTYVLDEALHLVPDGVVGELYLGGDQLARGYLDRPALSAQRFVADPFTPGARLYRSGDLVRRNTFGELEFVGRADEQVKVRGFRIELGEVESAIAAHPAVAHCVVVVTEDPAIGALLAAYVVPAADAVDLEAVHAFAAAALPEYMVPSAFAVIPEIPLTVNGKLDKRALPAATPAVVRTHRAPATATERKMCALFGTLFNLDEVGAEDSFFELGGHSLLAARLVAQVRAEFGVELDVRVVFDSPTPAALAANLVARFLAEFDIDLDAVDADFDDTASTEVAEPAVAPANPGRPAIGGRDRGERIPLSYSQLAMWFQYRMEGAGTVGNLPLTLRFDGALDIAALRSALDDVVARHESLRTTFPEHDGVPYQVVHPATAVPLPIREIAAADLSAELAALAGYAFTLDGEPLIRAELLVLDADTHVLSLLVHHIVADHASFGVLLDDLTTAYRARSEQGGAPSWTPLPIQFADYALWQRELFDNAAANEFAQAQLDYWRTTLAGVPEEISVAHDRPRPPVLGKRGEVVTFALPASVRSGLEALAMRSGATEFMVCQAAVATLLHTLGGGTDITLGTPVAARADAATTNLIGLFANMVVLRNDLSGAPTLRDTVNRARDVVLDANAHQELPIERLVEALNPRRSRSRNPLFQSMIHFRGADWAPATLPFASSGASTVTVVPADFDVSFLDLNLSLNVTADGGMDVRVVVNADLYDPATAALIADALAATLRAFAETPDLPVAELTVLPHADLERLLAAPEPVAVAAGAGAGVAGSDTERTLITLIEELLEIDEVTGEDNFFALGGDSVISIQWSARADALGLPMTPQLVFECATITELAAAVDAAAAAGPAPAEEPEQVSHAPMSASGLESDALSALTAAWNAQA